MSVLVVLFLVCVLFDGTLCILPTDEFAGNLNGTESPASYEDLDLSTSNVTISDETDVSPTEYFTSGNVTSTEHSSEEHESEEDVIDAKGCRVTLRNKLEDECFDAFEVTVSESLHMEEEKLKEKEVCCAVEGYEKCSIKGFKVARCEADQEAIKENLKATRIFLAALTSVSCAGHRGKCSSSNPSPTIVPSYLLIASGLLSAAAFM